MNLPTASFILQHELDPAEIPAVAHALLSPEVDDTKKADFLRALHQRGETVGELAGFVEAFLAFAVDPQLALDPTIPTIDVCGTGGDGLHLFNVSTAVMFVLAAGGIAVLKHGNRAITSKSGGADVLEALGIKIEMPPAVLRRCLDETGCGFLYAPAYHPSFKAVANVRRQLASEGTTTMFNLLGPLLNPARPEHQLVGIFSLELQEKYAAVLQKLGRKSAWIVHGTTADGRGMDELSTLGPTRVWALEKGELRQFTVDAKVREERDLHSMRGQDAAGNARTMELLLRGESQLEALQEIVSLNAGAAFLLTGLVPELQAGIDKAWALINTGEPWNRVEKLRKITRE